MDTGRLRTKTELKRFVAENIKRKGITDDMLSIMIDVLWRDPANLRTSGFYLPGGTDTIIDFDTPTRTFSIKPFDPLVENFIPRFGFFSWSYRAVYHRIFKEETIQIPNEEGLFAFYFGIAETTRLQELKFIKNPIEKELKKLYEKETIISFLYWRSDVQEVLTFGNDRHGSEWNPQHQYFNNLSFHAQRHSGMNVVGMEINEDGSLNSHAQFNTTLGKMWHDDFILDIPAAPIVSDITILYSFGGAPRFITQPNFGVYLAGARLGYNTGGGIATVDDKNFVCYHIFATNEHKTEIQKVISAMGTDQYTTLGAAYYGIETELTSIYEYTPYKGMCLLGTIILEIDNTYTNSVHARIVGFSGGSHPPVTIAEDSKDVLEITDKQVLSFKSPVNNVNQIAHGFTVGNAIRHNETSFVKAQANNDVNAQTCGIISLVIDADNFEYMAEGFLPGSWTDGKEYFLSPATAGQLIILPEIEVWNIGQVRQHIGFGTPQGLKIEIDVGDEIGEEVIDNSIYTEKSVTGTGSEFEKIKLVNDETTPAEDKYYGTDKNGARGYHELPKESVQQLTGQIPVFDLSLGRGAKITLVGNTTITFSNLEENDTGHIEILQDANGGHNLIFAGATIHIAENSYKAASEVQLTSIAASKDVVAYWFTGLVMNIAVIKNLQL